jgi:hypothetical protein
LNSLVVYFNVKCYNIWERNATIRSKIKIESTHSLGFGEIREEVTLRRLIVQSLECMPFISISVRYIIVSLTLF